MIWSHARVLAMALPRDVCGCQRCGCGRTGMVVPTSKWGEDHLTALSVKVHGDTRPLWKSLPPAVSNKTKLVFEDIKTEILALGKALPSQNDSAIRVACLEGTRGQYMSSTFCLAEIPRMDSTNDQTDESGDGSSEQQGYGKRRRRSTRRDVKYAGSHDGVSSEGSGSQSSSHSLTDTATLKWRAHAEVLNVRLAT